MTGMVRGEAEFLLYQAEDGRTRIEVRFDGETAWLSLGQMAELFQRDKSVISRHIKNVFEEGELDRASVVAEFATTAADGKTYQVEYYNLDLIISVGDRVKSHRGTQFRIWAAVCAIPHRLPLSPEFGALAGGLGRIGISNGLTWTPPDLPDKVFRGGGAVRLQSYIRPVVQI